MPAFFKVLFTYLAMCCALMKCPLGLCREMADVWLMYGPFIASAGVFNYDSVQVG